MKTIETKRKEALERQVKYNALTIRQKLQLIQERPGESHNERSRLYDQLDVKNNWTKNN